MSARDDDKIAEKKIIIIRTRPKTREEEREEAEEELFPSGGADSSRLYLSARLWVFPKENGEVFPESKLRGKRVKQNFRLETVAGMKEKNNRTEEQWEMEANDP
ncbi:hypothetical protein RUM44_011438 [Polyplax serrata]|uniref:Uncharacterized protein n=1 Tax=Polyplax serrata TaxID=468196 RepID=A0ABR1AQ43_POLSC